MLFRRHKNPASEFIMIHIIHKTSVLPKITRISKTPSKVYNKLLYLFKNIFLHNI